MDVLSFPPLIFSRLERGVCFQKRDLDKDFPGDIFFVNKNIDFFFLTFNPKTKGEKKIEWIKTFLQNEW